MFAVATELPFAIKRFYDTKPYCHLDFRNESQWTDSHIRRHCNTDPFTGQPIPAPLLVRLRCRQRDGTKSVECFNLVTLYVQLVHAKQQQKSLMHPRTGYKFTGMEMQLIEKAYENFVRSRLFITTPLADEMNDVNVAAKTWIAPHRAIRLTSGNRETFTDALHMASQMESMPQNTGYSMGERRRIRGIAETAKARQRLLDDIPGARLQYLLRQGQAQRDYLNPF
jgi:hypothetical protein